MAGGGRKEGRQAGRQALVEVEGEGVDVWVLEHVRRLSPHKLLPGSLSVLFEPKIKGRQVGVRLCVWEISVP